MSQYIIAVDLGGTRLRSARMDDDLNILMRHEELTLAHEGIDATLERVMSVIHQVMPGDPTTVDGIGISIPGPTNPFTGVVELGTNLKGWQGIPLAQLVNEEFGVPVYLGNDANVAALAEVARGAAQGCRHAIFITVSTGIGGGVIINGKMLLGVNGYAAEVGHMILEVDGKPTTLEKVAAGPALARQARSRIQSGLRSSMLDMVDGKLDAISGSTVGKAAREGDALALEIIHKAGVRLGYGVTSLLHIFNPEIVVFGGGVSYGVGDLLLEPMREIVQQLAIDDAYYKDLRYAIAELGENVSVVGAGALVATRGGVEDVAKAARKLAE
ncbi:MAG: ROK family protein [Chloroflexota bacterium]|nr:ROK family protein [Chloroflexota bacterium]